MTEALVSAIVPAYNAAATIDETLCSIRSQTFTNLEIIIVDDGSSDETIDIVGRHAALDPRVRLVSQANGGVAAARNRGIAEARGGLIAPVDADDLWSPDKIEKQLAALRAAKGRQVALVYTWFALIDADSRIVSTRYRPNEEGDVLARMCRGNLIGNGSSALMVKEAVVQAGGYDPTLRDRRAQGCEDLKLYFRMAERHRFALVPEYLTGYRQTATNMSSDVLQMLRSWILVADEMRQRRPDLAGEIDAGDIDLTSWLFGRAMAHRQISDATRLAARLFARDMTAAGRHVILSPVRHSLGRWRGRVGKALGRRSGSSLDAPRFPIGSPTVPAF